MDQLPHRPACLDKVFINVPLTMLVQGYLNMFIANRLRPEIGVDGEALDRYDRRTFARIGREFNRAGIQLTLHGPFLNLVPGAMDRKILGATRQRMNRFAELAPLLGPVGIVVHPEYDPRRHVFYRDYWLETTVATFEPLARVCNREGIVLSLENTYEQTPDILLELLPRLPGVGFCLDPGHVASFSGTPMKKWLAALGDKVTHLHLHDNDGSSDQHLPLGQGTIDFKSVFRHLNSTKGPPRPPLITLEPHREEDVPAMVLGLEQIWPRAWR
jgi:sugar phosphate isomerase/epimerase